MIGRQIDGKVWVDGVPATGVLSIEQEVRTERFERLDDPDLDWEYTDPAGHFHAWAKDKTLPTLVTSRRDVPCNGGCGLGPSCEGYSDVLWHCRICEAVVEPGTVTEFNATRRFPGLKHWSLAAHGGVELWNCDREVGVRFQHDDREWFGIGYVTGTEVSWGRVTLQVQGNGDLGERHAVRQVAA